MILVDYSIRAAILQGSIKIEPFDAKALGSNSYDVHLAPVLRTYKTTYAPIERVFHDDHYGGPGAMQSKPSPLDVRKKPETIDVRIPDEGFVLEPGKLYLGSTIEYTEAHRHLPFLEGKSSLGRYGLSIHVTAGKGDVGFCGHWTMEMHVVGAPLRIYAGMAVGQLIYHEVTGVPDVSYANKPGAKYNNKDPLPQPSAYWKNFEKSDG